MSQPMIHSIPCSPASPALRATAKEPAVPHQATPTEAPRRCDRTARTVVSTRRVLAALGMAALLVPAASATERTPVTEIKPLLMRAAAQGSAHGVLTGVGAAYLQRRFDTSSPVEVDVRRVRALPRPGCARLEVTSRQRAVLVRGNREEQELVYQLSYCADGRFPENR